MVFIFTATSSSSAEQMKVISARSSVPKMAVPGPCLSLLGPYPSLEWLSCIHMCPRHGTPGSLSVSGAGPLGPHMSQEWFSWVLIYSRSSSPGSLSISGMALKGSLCVRGMAILVPCMSQE